MGGLYGRSIWEVYVGGLCGWSIWEVYMGGLYGRSIWVVYMGGLYVWSIQHPANTTAYSNSKKLFGVAHWGHSFVSAAFVLALA